MLMSVLEREFQVKDKKHLLGVSLKIVFISGRIARNESSWDIYKEKNYTYWNMIKALYSFQLFAQKYPIKIVAN